MAKILVADDEAGLREFIADALALDGHEVAQAADGAKALELLEARGFDLLLTDLKMPRLDGLSLLQQVRERQPELEVIVLTAHGTIEDAVQAMRLGAFEFLQKPLSGPDELRLLATRALEHRGLKNLKAGTERVGGFGQGVRLTYGAPSMKPVLEAVQKVARTSATVLLLGESGVGKEVMARAIHESSPRQGKPFFAINCAALTETLLESELFGHEKGAFTGATERRRGRLELCDGGTFFLDEVGELKPELQAKLLRVLQERRFERVGGTQTLEVDVRWIAATNRPLQKMMEEGTFREDLYHRLAVFPVRLPPLRDRVEDIVPLAEMLLARICVDLKRPALSLSSEASTALKRYRWPGNVRELTNSLERAAILADGKQLSANDLWLENAAEPESGGVVPGASIAQGAPSSRASGLQTLAELEREAIVRTLAATGGNRRQAAEALEIGERTLYDKLKRYGID